MRKSPGPNADSIVAYWFDRIVPSDTVTDSWFSRKANRKTKLQGSAASGREILQSQISSSFKILIA
jgi:hypothetical protein